MVTMVDQGMFLGGFFQSVISTSYSPFSFRLEPPLVSSHCGSSLSKPHLTLGSRGRASAAVGAITEPTVKPRATRAAAPGMSLFFICCSERFSYRHHRRRSICSDASLSCRRKLVTEIPHLGEAPDSADAPIKRHQRPTSQPRC